MFLEFINSKYKFANLKNTNKRVRTCSFLVYIIN